MTGALVERPPRTTDAALRRLAELAPGDPRRPALRDEVVEAHLPLVRYLAARYRGLGEPLDDLVQVGTIGLIRAVDRFDPSRGTAFATFATPTVLGEIRRHFRDRAWAVQVPRRLRDLHVQLGRATPELTQRLGRRPTVAELAAHLGVDEETVLEGLEARHAYRVGAASDAGLDAGSYAGTAGGSSTGFTTGFTTGRAELRGRGRTPSGGAHVDPALEEVVDRESLRPLLHRLPAREKRLLVLRFFRGLTQSEIARELGISQMHVSRLLARTVASLRQQLVDQG